MATALFFSACIFDTEKVGKTDLEPRITVDTLLLHAENILLDSGETASVKPNAKGDSLQGHYLRTLRHIASRQYAIVTTQSQGGIVAVDSAFFSTLDTLEKYDTLHTIRIPATGVSDTVASLTVLTDTTVFMSPDSGLAFQRMHRKKSTITKSYTGAMKIGDKEKTIRHLMDTTTVSDSASADSLRFFALDSVLTNRTDSLVAETVLRETRFRKGQEHTVVRDMKKVVTLRKVTVYVFKYISAKWVQNSENQWVQVADTLLGRFASPESQLENTLLYQDTLALSPEMVVATLSDYRTGSYSAISLDGRVIQNKIAPIHADAFVRYFGGDNFYIVNSYGRDNVQIVDKSTLKTVGQFALPSLSNPHDLLKHKNKLYAILFGLNSIRIHDALSGAYLDQIDISAYADTSDGIAEATTGLIEKNMLYVALARIDQNAGWIPLPTVLLRVNLENNSIDTLSLPFTNPNRLILDGNGDLIVSANGNFGVEDGGLIRVDLNTFAVKDTLITEADLGGDLTGALLADGKWILRISSFTADKVFQYDASNKNLQEIVSTSAYGFSGMTYDAEGKTLFLSDVARGLRLFSIPGLAEKQSSGISMGLPVRSMAVIR